MDDNRTGQGRPATGGSYAQASSSTQAGMDRAASAAASAKDVAGSAAGQAKDQASSLVGQVKDKAVAAVSDQKEGLADRLDGFVQSLHKSGEQFAGQQDWIAEAIERGASELGSLATSLRENDVASLITQVKSLAKRQPALFVGASLAAGFAVARFGKIVAADVSHDDLPTLPEVGHGGR